MEYTLLPGCRIQIEWFYIQIQFPIILWWILFNEKKLSFQGTPEWKVDYDGSWSNDIENESLALVQLKLTRNSEFYVIFLILPTVVVSSVSLASILLPLEITQGEKVPLKVVRPLML